LTTFLPGLLGGSALAARRVDRGRAPGLALGLVQLGVALSVLLGLAILDELPYAFVRVFRLAGGRYDVLLPLEFALSGSAMFLPALLSGATFPLAVRLVAEGGPIDAGRPVGRLYALNTTGAIGGSFLAGFGLIPLVGIHGTLVLAVLLSLGLAFLLLIAVPGPRRVLALSLAGMLPFVAVAIAAGAPGLNPLMMATGVRMSAPAPHSLSGQPFRDAIQRPNL